MKSITLIYRYFTLNVNMLIKKLEVRSVIWWLRYNYQIYWKVQRPSSLIDKELTPKCHKTFVQDVKSTFYCIHKSTTNWSLRNWTKIFFCWCHNHHHYACGCLWMEISIAKYFGNIIIFGVFSSTFSGFCSLM